MALACLALEEANDLTILTQALTSFASEALGAKAEWAHPLIAGVRPHVGQVEASQLIRPFLRGSKLISGLEPTKDRFKAGLAQERYALRSSPQRLGPLLEDLLSALSQIKVELNSSLHNPVVNAVAGDIHCGANFQAAVATLATE